MESGERAPCECAKRWARILPTLCVLKAMLAVNRVAKEKGQLEQLDALKANVDQAGLYRHEEYISVKEGLRDGRAS